MSGCNCARGQVAGVITTCDGKEWTGTAILFSTAKSMGLQDWLPGGEWIHPDDPMVDVVAFYNERVCPMVELPPPILPNIPLSVETCDGVLTTGQFLSMLAGGGVFDVPHPAAWTMDELLLAYKRVRCPDEGGSILPLVLIGGAVGGLFLLARKKRKY